MSEPSEWARISRRRAQEAQAILASAGLRVKVHAAEVDDSDEWRAPTRGIEFVFADETTGDLAEMRQRIEAALTADPGWDDGLRTLFVWPEGEGS